jgi:hypothetical protein
MSSTTRTWLLGGVMLVIAACGGAASSGPGEDAGGEPRDGAGDVGLVEDASHADTSTGGDAGSDWDGGGFDSGGSKDTGAAHDASDSGAADTSTVPDAAWTIAVPTNIPQVQDNGAAVLKTPVFQSISFSGYDQTAAIDAFVESVGTTTYWTDAVAEYGVGPATVQPPVHLTAMAPGKIDDSAIGGWLATTLASNVGLMSPSANALYIISYPSTTTVTLEGSNSCTGFGAYHNSAAVGGVQVAYAIIPECTYAPSTTLQTTTDSLSHELAEATTDPVPIPYANSTWQGTDVNHTFWEVITGGDGELGDMCSFFSSSFFTPAGYSYDVQRIWSNKAAKEGHDPCQPELPGEVYFTGVPLMTDQVAIVWDGQSGYTTEGVQIAVGSSKTVPVQLYSEGPMAAWTVSATEYPSTKNLTFAWDKTTGQNGDTLNLTITVSGTDTTYGGNAFYIESTSGSLRHTWLAFAGR